MERGGRRTGEWGASVGHQEESQQNKPAAGTGAGNVGRLPAHYSALGNSSDCRTVEGPVEGSPLEILWDWGHDTRIADYLVHTPATHSTTGVSSAIIW